MGIFDDVNNWQKTEGAALFASILNLPDPVILDYGCGAGTYSFAAAYAFDQKCKVYAVDINKQCLDYIDDKAKKEKISCIITAEGREDCRHEFDDDTFDLVLYADMFHGEGKPYDGLHRFVMLEEAKRKRRNFTSPRFIRDETEDSRSAAAHRRTCRAGLPKKLERPAYLRVEGDSRALKVVDHRGRYPHKVSAFEG